MLMVVDCGNNKKKIQLFSFGIPGQGFYAMELPEEQMKKEQTIGLVSVYEGLANEERLNEELKDAVNDKWDFQPRKMDSNGFLVVFPDKGSLETFSKIGSLELSKYKLKVKITKSSHGPKITLVLQTCWVKIGNVPPIAREVSAIKSWLLWLSNL